MKGILKYKVPPGPGDGGPGGEAGEAGLGPVRRKSESNAGGPGDALPSSSSGGATGPAFGGGVGRTPSVLSAAGSAASSEPFDVLRVLIGDADELTRRTLVLMFQLAGAEVEVAADAPAVEAALAEDMLCADCVALDDGLGGGSARGGREALARVEMQFARAGVQVPVLVLMESGLDAADTATDSGQTGSNAEGSGALNEEEEQIVATFQVLRKPLTQPMVNFLVQRVRQRKRRQGPQPQPRPGGGGIERSHSYTHMAAVTPSGVRVEPAAAGGSSSGGGDSGLVSPGAAVRRLPQPPEQAPAPAGRQASVESAGLGSSRRLPLASIPAFSSGRAVGIGGALRSDVFRGAGPASLSRPPGEDPPDGPEGTQRNPSLF